jgi:Chromo (CHRromatin Organisation MOdifier) domain
VKDKQLVEVEEILAHAGDIKGPKCELYFKVRWKDLTGKEDSWLPGKDLLHNTVLHGYLCKKKLSSILPNQYRTENKQTEISTKPSTNKRTKRSSRGRPNKRIKY